MFCCRVADTAKHPSLRQLQQMLEEQLLKDGQDKDAAALMLRQGDVQAAVDCYMRAGMPNEAAKVWPQISWAELYDWPGSPSHVYHGFKL